MKQSPNDFKKYQPLTLDNGLRVLLIENVDTQKSAAALAVNVGHFNDPDNRQGLAHFLEHMLFLGTKDYPDGSEYQKFISQHGGSNNAWTATEHTCFFFDIHHQYFAQAIKRFGQFFTVPLLSQEFVHKERKNIDAEFKMKLKDDIRRLYDVHKETINPAHPFSKFSVGNSETLGDLETGSIRDEVANFFEKHYVAKAMTLVLEGPHSLDELASLAHQNFSTVSGNCVPEKNPDVPLYLPEQQKISLHVKPVKEDHQLIISFALPAIDYLYVNKPESILSYLLGHEGPDSILSTLKQQGWALGLSAGSGINGYNFKDFNISIRLTELGESHINDIISLVFSYIALLKKDKIPSHYFTEKKAISTLAFDYHEKTKPLDSVCQLVINMHHYPVDDYIFGDYRMDKMDYEQIDHLLQFFSPQNMRYVIISPNVKTNQVSQWYEVPYRIEKISSNSIKCWQANDLDNTLTLPPINSYIVENPPVYHSPEGAQTTELVPTDITSDNGLTIWFKQDHTFKTPKGYIYIGIDSPITIESDTNIAMTRLFVDLYCDAVVEQHYDAELAGIHYHLYSHQGGLTLQVSGVSEKQPLLVEKLLAQLQSFSISPDKFSLLKQQLISQWNNADNSKSISQLFSALSHTMQPKNPSTESLANSLAKIDYDEFLKFCRSMFDEIAVEALIHGNWQSSVATEIENIIKQTFNDKFHEKNHVNVPVLDIKNKGELTLPLYLPEHDHASVIYYPMDNKSLETIAKTMIVSQLLSPLFFQQMRTEKQYGYLVGVGFVPINKYPGLAFYIQSPNVDAQQLITAMSDFINECHLAVEQMPDEHWQHLQHGLASQLQEKDTSLRIKSQRFWAAICTKDTDFMQKKRLIDVLLSLTKNDIHQFLLTHINSEKQTVDRFCLMSLKQTKNANILNTKAITHHNINETLKNCSVKY